MQLDEQGRFQRILQELEGAYRQDAALPVAGQPPPEAKPPAENPRLQRIFQELESAYPSNYQMLQRGAMPTPEKKPGAVGDVLSGAEKMIQTIGAGGWQGIAGWVDVADKIYDQLLRKEYQQRYEAIRKAKVPGQENMTDREIQAAKMKMYEEIGPLDEWLEANKAKALENTTDALTKLSESHAAAGIPVTENKVMEVIRQVGRGLGQAAIDVPVYMMGGRGALPVFGAARGYGEKGTAEGAVVGGIEGAMLQNMIHAIGLLPTKAQLPTWFGFGAATTPGDIQERTVGGLTWLGLGVAGRGKREITLREFIERYPRIQRRIDDSSALKVLKTVAPEISPEVISSHGGAKAMLDKLIALKDRFGSVMEVFKKSGQDPAALEAMLNKPEMVPLFRELMGVTEQGPLRLPAKARFMATETGQIVGEKFPEELLLKIGYREAELGRRMTPEELATFFEAERPPAPAEKPVAPEKPAKAPKEAKKPAKPSKRDMEIQLMSVEDAVKLPVEEFTKWVNPRFRVSYDPTNESDMAAFRDLVKALGMRGDDVVLNDVANRIKVPEKPPEGTPPAGAAPAAPPPAAPPAPPSATPAPTPTPTPTPGAKPPKKPSASHRFTSPRSSRLPTETPMLTWIRRQGGISLSAVEAMNMKGEFAALLENPKWRRLFRRKGGLSPSELMEMAWEDGRIKEEGENAFIEAIYNEVSGKGKHYSRDESEKMEPTWEKEAADRMADVSMSQAAEYALNEWLNGREIGKPDAELIEREMQDPANRRTRAENLKRNELLERLEKEGKFSREDIEDFLDDTYYDGNKAREIARDVMDGKLSEQEGMRLLREKVEDVAVTSFKPEEFGEVAPEAPAKVAEKPAEFLRFKTDGTYRLTSPAGKNQEVLLVNRATIGRESVWEVLFPDGRTRHMTAPELRKYNPVEIRPEAAPVEDALFSLKQEPLVPPKKEAEAAQPKLFEPGKIERVYPPGFDNRGLGTWPNQEAMRKDLSLLIAQGWVAEYGQSPEGKAWARLIERKVAGEGELRRGEVKLPEFGKPLGEEAQLSIDDELSGSIPFKSEKLESRPKEGVEVREPETKPKEPDDFEKWYRSQMEELDKDIEAVPKGQVKAFRLDMKDIDGTARFLGNFAEEARAELLEHAKKKDVDDLMVFGERFNAKAENVQSPKELDVAKDVIDWLSETAVERKGKAEGEKLQKDLFGEGETELFAGIGPPKSVRDALSRAVEKFDIEALFKRLGGKDTGLNVKLYFTRKNMEFTLSEKAVKDLKALAKKSNGGKDLSAKDYQRIFVLASKPKAFTGLSPAEQARLGPVIRAVRSFFDNYIAKLRKAGVIEDPWPLSAVRRMRAEIQDYQERIDRGAKNAEDLKELVGQRKRAIAFLETTGMRYVNIPRYWIEAFFNAKPQDAPKVLSELFGKRETLDIEWLANKLLKDGHIEPADLDIRRMMMMYGHQAGHKIALGEIIRSAKKDRLIISAEEAPETWPRLAQASFPTLKGYRMHPEMLKFMETNYLKPGWAPPYVGAIMGTIKMGQFYNPLNLSQYSMIQSAWTGAVTTLKMPKVFGTAVRDMVKKTPQYWEAYYWGAFPDPFSPSHRQAEARVRKILGQDPILKKVATQLNPYHYSLWLAWEMENFFKMASYNYLREKKFSPREAAQLAAKAGADYAAIPPATRKVLNKILFTPSFTIAMFGAQAEMVGAAAKLMAKPKLLFDKTGDARYLRQMAKGAVYLAGGLALKEMLFHKLGYKTDVFGLKWSKEVEDEDGNTRELVVHMAAPDNVIIRYLNDLRLIGGAENKAEAFVRRATWKLHPIWVTSLEILQNKRLDGTPVWNPWDSSFEGRKKALLYTTRRLIRITELLPEQGQGNLSKLKAIKALQDDLGKFGGLVVSLYSIPYQRSTADRRLMYEMTQMLEVFKKANKATPPKDEDEAEERATWLQDELEKIRKRIEEIRE